MLSDDLKKALDVALNEASLLGFEFDPERRLAAATLGMLSLPADGGPMPDDSRVQFLFHDVGRLAVSYRAGRWNDRDAVVNPLTADQVLATVQSFGGLPVYGWKFFDQCEREMAKWGDRLSLDWIASPTLASPHSLTLFQEGPDRHLDLCVWFASLETRSPDGRVLSLERVAEAGKRWWDAFYAQDPRTKGMGMFPLK